STANNEELELSATKEPIPKAAEDRYAEELIRRGKDYEIIAVDDASSDETSDIARNACTQVVRINRRQIAAARNAGAGAAKGEILFFVDADTGINSKRVGGAIAALEEGCAGGGARIVEIGRAHV